MKVKIAAGYICKKSIVDLEGRSCGEEPQYEFLFLEGTRGFDLINDGTSFKDQILEYFVRKSYIEKEISVEEDINSYAINILAKYKNINFKNREVIA